MTKVSAFDLAAWDAEHPPKPRRTVERARDIAAKIENIRVAIPTPLARCQATINLAAMDALDVADVLGLAVEAAALLDEPRPAVQPNTLPWYRR